MSVDAVAAARAVLELVDLARAGSAPAPGAEAGTTATTAPVVILAGGTDRDGESVVSSYREALLDGLGELSGTLISGATTVGVAALAGDLRHHLGSHVRAIGYAPAEVPSGIELETDPRRIDEIRRTGGRDFGVAEPIAYWGDILAAGIQPERVGIIGIGGGPISMLEYSLAGVIGAQLGIVAGSGRAADRFLEERAQRTGAASSLGGDAAGFRSLARRLAGSRA